MSKEQRRRECHEALLAHLRKMNETYGLGEIAWALRQAARDWGKAAAGETR